MPQRLLTADAEALFGGRLPRLVICAMAVIFYASAPLWAGRVFDLPAATDVLATRLCLGVVAPVHLLAAIAEYFWVASGLAETLLLASAREDPEPEVAEHAQALLYRLGVGRNVRRSGHLSGARFADYQAKARRLGAEARISQRK